MIVAFDGSLGGYTGYWPGLVALGALAGCLLWKLSGRSLKWYVPAVIAIIGILGGGVPLWDQYRVRRMIASGEGLHTTRGTIIQTWHISERRRDWSGSGNHSVRYKTVVSEGFDVGADRFSWVHGSCLSAVALCSLAQSKVPLVRNMAVEVTWFEDPAQGNDKRVVRLLVQPL